MDRKSIVEVFELDPALRWQYLRRFCDEAMGFYDARESVLDGAEVEEAICLFKEKPEPTIRKALRLSVSVVSVDGTNPGVSQATLPGGGGSADGPSAERTQHRAADGSTSGPPIMPEPVERE